MSQVFTPYLNFNGNCRDAMQFYAECFDGKVLSMMTFGESPAAEHVPADQHGGIMHASIQINGEILMASDAFDNYEKPQGLWISLNYTDIAKAEKVFADLAREGQVVMPLEKTFWAERFGMVTDRFGTPWMMNCEVPAV